MATFITGSTGYLGSHVASGLLESHGQKLNLLVRAKDRRAAELKLWRCSCIWIFHAFIIGSILTSRFF